MCIYIWEYTYTDTYTYTPFKCTKQSANNKCVNPVFYGLYEKGNPRRQTGNDLPDKMVVGYI